MTGRLIAEEGILKGTTIPFENGEEWIVGRDPDVCQILIEDPSVSRRHLLCKNTPQGLSLENLSTSNPIQVNDQEVVGPVILKNGDTIRVGSGLYRYATEEQQQEQQAPPPDISSRRN